jgi:hypothetical protein
MKAIAAAIVVVAGAYLLKGGAEITRGDTANIVMLIGTGVLVAGLWLLFRESSREGK